MNTQSPTVLLHAFPFGAGMVKVDVEVKDVPPDLFGAAFHLVIDGLDDQEWGLYKYESGNVFEEAGEGIMTLVSPRNEPKNELVVGISLRRDAMIKAQDGTLISFYLTMEDAGSLSLRFEEAVLSLLKEQRVDLPDVTWQEAAVDLQNAVENPASEALQTSVLAGSNSAQKDAEALAADRLWLVYGFLGGVLLLVILLLALLRLRKKRQNI